jgi:hypothetical protein
MFRAELELGAVDARWQSGRLPDVAPELAGTPDEVEPTRLDDPLKDFGVRPREVARASASTRLPITNCTF